MPLGDFFEEQFKFAEIFNMLKLNDEETALLAGVMIMNPGEFLLMKCCRLSHFMSCIDVFYTIVRLKLTVFSRL